MVEFKFERVSERVTRILGTSGELWYLAVGNERAALLDTGSGIGHMRPLIDRLTDKPLIILLTHGHVDHAMGATEFDCPVYMSPADDPVYESHKGLEVRKGGLGMADPAVVAKIEDGDFIPPREKPFLPLAHGDIFDLGGLTVETYACPGHTPGSVVFLLREERTVLLGDACNFFTFLFFDYCAPIQRYRENLLTLKEQLAGKYDRVLLSHGDGNAPVGIIDGVVGVCDDILAGRTDDVPFSFMGEPAFVAKAMPGGRPDLREDGGIGNIVYRKDNVWEK